VAALALCDVMLLPHGFTGPYHPVEYETIFPTKTIEYLISGRPILAHTPPGAFLTRFLRDHDCALVVDTPDHAAVLAAVQRLLTDAPLRARLVRNALKAAEQFQVKRVVAEFREVLKIAPTYTKLDSGGRERRHAELH
jgi:glycosyltransferase involved in cell wall biosynthesis